MTNQDLELWATLTPEQQAHYTAQQRAIARTAAPAPSNNKAVKVLVIILITAILAVMLWPLVFVGLMIIGCVLSQPGGGGAPGGLPRQSGSSVTAQLNAERQAVFAARDAQQGLPMSANTWSYMFKR